MSGVDSNATVSVLADEVDDNQPADHNYYLVTSMKEYLIEEMGNRRRQALAEYVLYKSMLCHVLNTEYNPEHCITSLGSGSTPLSKRELIVKLESLCEMHLEKCYMFAQLLQVALASHDDGEVVSYSLPDIYVPVLDNYNTN
jgi:hypothetical protein